MHLGFGPPGPGAHEDTKPETSVSYELGTDFESGYSPWSSVTAGDRLPCLPEHQLHASIGLERDAWKLRLASTFNGAMRTVAGQGALVPEQSTESVLLVNVSAEDGATPWASVYAAVQNATDVRYVAASEPAGVRPGLPRTVQVGVRVTNR